MQMPLNEILGRYFTAPLGAGNTLYNPLTRIDSLWVVPTEDDSFVRRQLLRGYVHDEAAAFMGGVSGNAGLFSNANDLAKLLQMLLNDGVYGGERYLQQETLRLFTQSKTPTCTGDWDTTSPGRRIPGFLPADYLLHGRCMAILAIRAPVSG